MSDRPNNSEEPRFAIVTGAGSGIGRALVTRLSALGWTVAAADINGEAAAETIRSLPSPSPQTHAVALDVSEVDAWDELLAGLRGRWPRLDLLVNNAGVLLGGPLAETDLAALRRLVDVNLLGPLIGSRAATPWLLESASRRQPADRRSPRAGIINTASIFAAIAPPGFAVYSATKAAVVAMSESQRGELAASDLNVTVALPGAVSTGLFERAEYRSAVYRDAAQRFVDRAELTAEEVAEQMIRAAARGRACVVIGRRARRYARLKRWLPDLTGRRVIAQAQRELQPP